MAAVINVQNLSKQFKDILAVNNLSFTVNERGCVWIFRPEWRRKIHYYTHALSLVQPTSGKIEIFKTFLPIAAKF